MSEEIKKEKYVEVDKNLAIETSFPETDVCFHSVREDPFELYNFYDPRGEAIFRRLPEDVARATSEGVFKLSRESAGGRVRFSTDSPYILIKAVMPVVGRNSHMTLAMSAGFDLYEDYKSGESRYHRVFMPPYDMDGGYEQIIRFGSRKMRHFTINFPIHSVVSELYVGLAEGSALGAGLPYRSKKPIIIYGSSIVHGTAATRPGLVYTNILSRYLNMNVINLGFSGKALAEDAIIDYISKQEMLLFVLDYDHNAPTPEYLRDTHLPTYKKIRASQPDLPIIMVTRPNVATNGAGAMARKDVVIDTYRAARDAGDERVYYVDGESFFLGKFENECTMDGVHPNDLGFTLMADGIGSEIRRAMSQCGVQID